jgi:hypothetical protein
MEVSGQPHAPVALLARKEPPVPTGYDAGWASEPVRKIWKENKNLLSLSGIEPRYLSCQLYGPTFSSTIYFGLVYVTVLRILCWQECNISATKVYNNLKFRVGLACRTSERLHIASKPDHNPAFLYYLTL